VNVAVNPVSSAFGVNGVCTIIDASQAEVDSYESAMMFACDGGIV
jgi:hypothetical protein